jgi:hypothetical protein
MTRASTPKAEMVMAVMLGSTGGSSTRAPAVMVTANDGGATDVDETATASYVKTQGKDKTL